MPFTTRVTAAVSSRGRRLVSTAARPFRVLGLQQVAIGGLDKQKLSALWEGVLGVPRIGGEQGGLESAQLALRGAQLRLELVGRLS